MECYILRVLRVIGLLREAGSYTFGYGLSAVGGNVKVDTLSIVSWQRLNKKTDSLLAIVVSKSDSTLYSTKANATKVRDSLQANINLKAPITSPTFAGVPKWNTDTLATKADVRNVNGNGTVFIGANQVIGDGSTTTFSVAHLLSGVTTITHILATPKSAAATKAYYSLTTTNIILSFETAPANGASIDFNWQIIK
jgi:hypothetical protein